MKDMGRIRPTYIKRVSIELINKYPQAFNKDFDNNKEMVATLTDVQTVPMRNKIAGYITRYLSHPEA
ncbi:SSU ribosomal protein S17e [Candidatus Methanomethylophilus alvi Mx1201]|uniref:Small ribosomal subunit protein eS17 n=2 Tax=Methanomethylophilus alvi TaxID=1291540 RepID=M9SLN6_METAX|nr:SSU ribosomal protein S17e [Candidatus Methanomethylophilus alvi Mx1201]